MAELSTSAEVQRAFRLHACVADRQMKAVERPPGAVQAADRLDFECGHLGLEPGLHGSDVEFGLAGPNLNAFTGDFGFELDALVQPYDLRAQVPAARSVARHAER
jgi:hypothetical protein